MKRSQNQGLSGWKNFARGWTRGLGGLENWPIFMDLMCVSTLTYEAFLY